MSESTEEPLVAQIYKGRERRMYPEVAEYLRRFQEVQWAEEDRATELRHDLARRETAMYRVAERAGRRFNRYGPDADAWAEWRALSREGDARNNEIRERESRELQALLTDSPHREVKWIAEHCLFSGQGNEVENYARDILAILPATVEQIWEEAKSNRGMCDVFDRYYDQAEAAGVFNDGVRLPGRREKSAFRSYLRREGYHSTTVSNFMNHFDRYAKALQEHYEEQMAAAKAEWQGLDEAWRSERSRRGAATRRARADGTQEAQTERVREELREALGFNESPEPQPEAPKASAQDDFALVNAQ